MKKNTFLSLLASTFIFSGCGENSTTKTIPPGRPIQQPATSRTGTPYDFTGTHTGHCSFSANSGENIPNGFLTLEAVQSATALNLTITCCPSQGTFVGCYAYVPPVLTINGNDVTAANGASGAIGDTGLSFKTTNINKLDYIFDINVSEKVGIAIRTESEGSVSETLNGSYAL